MSRRFFPWSAILGVFLVQISTLAPAQVISVPVDHPSIQAALNAAGSGTVILVAPGRYLENVVWPVVDGIRLRSIDGPGSTVISGNTQGTAIRMGSGLTRATVVEGFTITGGRAPLGAGLYVESLPTIRGNIIQGNRGEDPTLSAGAGLYAVSSAAPRIEGNEIRGNVLSVSKDSRGAGLCVLGNGTEVVGNLIADNVCSGVNTSEGGGVFAGQGVLIASNLIVRNEVNGGQGFSRGGGISASQGDTIVGNTVADNQCTGIRLALGGGVALVASSAQSIQFLNNIVVQNVVYGAQTTGGGVYSNLRQTFDYNDVWWNVGGDFFGCSPGPGGLSVDPQFAAGGAYRLSSTSPLIDRGDSTAVPSSVGIDVDTDPRRLDGRLNGSARVDIGGDEYTPVHLALTGSRHVGDTLFFRVTSPPGAYQLFASTTRGRLLVPPFGHLLLGAPFQPLGAGSAPGQTVLPVPAVNALAGIPLLVQGFVQLTGFPGVGLLTNRVDATLGKASVIHERFLDRSHRETGATTAAWMLAAQPGLFATYGYGGNGEEGNLVLTGPMTLDTDSREPGPDGVAHWDFVVLHVGPTGSLRLVGSRPVRLNALGAVVIEATIDASGYHGQAAPAGTAAQIGRLAGGAGGPGGGAGGDANTNPLHPIGGLPMELRGAPGWPRAQTCNQPNRSDNRLITVVESNCGGGTGGNRGLPSGSAFRDGCSGNGGGHAQDGLQTDYLCSNIGAFGREYGVKWIVSSGTGMVSSFTAGTGGGAGGNAAVTAGNPLPSDDIVAGSGGGGGGALEIFSAGSFLVKSTAVVRSDGGHGGAGHTTLVSSTTVRGGFGGGGAGGSVWFTGASVTVEASATVSAVGGAGNPNPPAPPLSGGGGDGYVVVRDRTGQPTVHSQNITPPPLAGVGAYVPQATGSSQAVSTWYQAIVIDPQWAFDASDPKTGLVKPGQDLTFLNPPLAGQTVTIEWQGTTDLNGQPSTNPMAWYPSTFTPDITQLRGRGLRWVRFRIRFEAGPTLKPFPQMLAIQALRIRY